MTIPVDVGHEPPRDKMFTEFEPEAELVDSQWGTVSNMHWCQLEGERLKPKYADVRIAWKDSCVCLWAPSAHVADRRPKLTAAAVAEIRDMAAKGWLHIDIAQKFNVSHTMINRIVNGMLWKEGK